MRKNINSDYCCFLKSKKKKHFSLKHFFSRNPPKNTNSSIACVMKKNKKTHSETSLSDDLIHLIILWAMKNFVHHEKGRLIGSSWNRVLQVDKEERMKLEYLFSRQEVKWYREDLIQHLEQKFEVGGDFPFSLIPTQEERSIWSRQRSISTPLCDVTWNFFPGLNWHPGHLTVLAHESDNHSLCRLNLMELWNRGFAPDEMKMFHHLDLDAEFGWTLKEIPPPLVTSKIPEHSDKEGVLLCFRLSIDPIPDHHIEILLCFPSRLTPPQSIFSRLTERFLCTVSAITPNFRKNHPFSPSSSAYLNPSAPANYPFHVATTIWTNTMKFQLRHVDYRHIKVFDFDDFHLHLRHKEKKDWPAHLSYQRYATDLERWFFVNLRADQCFDHGFDTDRSEDIWCHPFYVVSPSEFWSFNHTLLLGSTIHDGLCLFSVTSQRTKRFSITRALSDDPKKSLRFLLAQWSHVKVLRHPLDPHQIYLEVPGVFSTHKIWSGVLSLKQQPKKNLIHTGTLEH